MQEELKGGKGSALDTLLESFVQILQNVVQHSRSHILSLSSSQRELFLSVTMERVLQALSFNAYFKFLLFHEGSLNTEQSEENAFLEFLTSGFLVEIDSGFLSLVEIAASSVLLFPILSQMISYLCHSGNNYTTEIIKCYRSRLSSSNRASSLFASTELSDCHLNCTAHLDISRVLICYISCFLNMLRLGGQVPLTYTASESPKKEMS